MKKTQVADLLDVAPYHNIRIRPTFESNGTYVWWPAADTNVRTAIYTWESGGSQPGAITLSHVTRQPSTHRIRPGTSMFPFSILDVREYLFDSDLRSLDPQNPALPVSEMRWRHMNLETVGVMRYCPVIT